MKNESDFNFNELPMEVQNMIEQELETDETITWMDQPRPLLLIIPSLAFALVGLMDVIFWAYLFFSGPKFFGKVFLFVEIAVFLIGLGFICAPLWVISKLKKVYYLLTDQRALIIQAGRNVVIQSYKPNQLKSIERKEQISNAGSILFANLPSEPSKLFSVEGGFLGINNVNEVYDRIVTLAENSAD